MSEDDNSSPQDIFDQNSRNMKNIKNNMTKISKILTCRKRLFTMKLNKNDIQINDVFNHYDAILKSLASSREDLKNSFSEFIDRMINFEYPKKDSQQMIDVDESDEISDNTNVTENINLTHYADKSSRKVQSSFTSKSIVEDLETIENKMEAEDIPLDNIQIVVSNDESTRRVIAKPSIHNIEESSNSIFELDESSEDAENKSKSLMKEAKKLSVKKLSVKKLSVKKSKSKNKSSSSGDDVMMDKSFTLPLNRVSYLNDTTEDEEKDKAAEASSNEQDKPDVKKKVSFDRSLEDMSEDKENICENTDLAIEERMNTLDIIKEDPKLDIIAKSTLRRSIRQNTTGERPAAIIKDNSQVIMPIKKTILKASKPSVAKSSSSALKSYLKTTKAVSSKTSINSSGNATIQRPPTIKPFTTTAGISKLYQNGTKHSTANLSATSSINNISLVSNSYRTPNKFNTNLKPKPIQTSKYKQPVMNMSSSTKPSATAQVKYKSGTKAVGPPKNFPPTSGGIRERAATSVRSLMSTKRSNIPPQIPDALLEYIRSHNDFDVDYLNSSDDDDEKKVDITKQPWAADKSVIKQLAVYNSKMYDISSIFRPVLEVGSKYTPKDIFGTFTEDEGRLQGHRSTGVWN